MAVLRLRCPKEIGRYCRWFGDKPGRGTSRGVREFNLLRGRQSAEVIGLFRLSEAKLREKA